MALFEGEPWIGVDLDGTLAEYDHWRGAGHIGPAIPAMTTRVRDWLTQGVNVAILTARVSVPEQVEEVTAAIEAWCEEQFGQVLPVTCSKDYSMIELWDDRAVQVVRNTGVRADGRL